MNIIERVIPATGEQLPVIGLGTWQTFDVNTSEYDKLKQVLSIMQQHGGRLIDSSPMYGRAEQVVGDITSEMDKPDSFFYATKVWTSGGTAGRQQIEASYRLMRRTVMDLVQIHNLLDWRTHLPYLRQLKDEGKLRYIGITHYQDSSHDALAQVIKKEPVDFVQFNYSILSRHAEKMLLPLCAEKGVATLINRPFGEGAYFRKVADKQLPAWAKEAGINSWAAFFLQYIIAHPAVTCVIPATSNPLHAEENFLSGTAAQMDQSVRRRMIEFIS